MLVNTRFLMKNQLTILCENKYIVYAPMP